MRHALRPLAWSFASFVLSAQLAAADDGSPLDHLPPNIEVLTTFGERADFSPDGKEVAFIGKSFGDAFAIDLATRRVRCLTCQVQGAAFLRVMHLSNGDYLLIGPPHFYPENPGKGRGEENQLWYMSRRPGARPVALGVHNFEGAAVSKRALKLAWATSPVQDESLPPETYRLFVGELKIEGDKAEITNKRQLHQSTHPPCKLEAQDFFDHDRKLTFACYLTPADHEEKARVMSIDLASGKIVDQSKTPIFNEPEGVFPDGKALLVESDEHARARGQRAGVDGWQIDLYRMALDGTGKNRTRLTFFNETGVWHASNPVVAPDGRSFAFHIGRAKDVGAYTGAGTGILLYRFDEAAAAKPPGGGRFFEQRTYVAHPGKLAALMERFEKHTFAYFKKHGMELVGFWRPIDGAEATNTLVYTLAYPSREARDAAWKAFQADPGWVKAKAESEKDGPLVEKVISTYLAATPDSPIR